MEQLKFTPTPKQREAHRLLKENNIVLYGGAIRGAKSYWGCLEIVTFCFQYPNSRWLMLRESMPTLKRTLLKTFNEYFLGKGLQAYVRHFNQQTQTITWNNGSEIIFMAESYDTDKELNRFRGLEINGAFVDEVNEINEETFNKIIERAGSWFGSPGCPTKILMSCNPNQGWTKDRFYDRWKAGTLPKGVAYLQARIEDNPHIPQEYIESLKMLPKYQYKVFVEGEWDISLKTGGEFYKCFELDKHVGHCEYNPELPLHISWDDNVNPYLPVGIFQIEGKAVRMIDEIAGVNPNNTIKAVCSEIKRKYMGHKSGMFVYGDSTAQKDDTKIEKGYDFFRLVMEELREFLPQRRVASSNPSVVARGMWINTFLETGRGGITFMINDSCKKAINDFINLKEAADGTKNKEMETVNGVRYQKYGHFTDLTDYLFCFAFAQEYAEYQRGGIVTNPMTGKNVSKHGY